MRITMVKKQLANGDACEKCAQTEDMLKRRGYWDRVDEVVWAIEGDDHSHGVELGRQHGIKVAPFFILADDDGGETVYTSPLRLIRDHFTKAVQEVPADQTAVTLEEVDALSQRFASQTPEELVRYALERFGDRCAIALSGAEDVALVDMAANTGLPYRVFFVDSGRMHTVTYGLIDAVRLRYGIEVATVLPDAQALTKLLESKGLNSFLNDGHEECCAIRRGEPLSRALKDCDAWIGLSNFGRELEGRVPPSIVELEPARVGHTKPLLRISPLATWDTNQIWSYIRKHEVPHNELHAEGYRSIGCEPCTRAIRSDQNEREGLWWWEGEGSEASGRGMPGDGI